MTPHLRLSLIMNCFCTIAALSVLAASGARADDAAALPVRAAVAKADYQGTLLVVTGASSLAPVVYVKSEKKEETLDQNAQISVWPEGEFAPGFVKISDITPNMGGATDPDAMGTNLSGSSHTVTWGATLNSSVAIDKAFALFYFQMSKGDDNSAPTIGAVVRPIDPLPAGKDVRYRVILPSLEKFPNTEWKILVFAGPLEVPSTGMEELLPGYFDQVDRIVLKKEIAQREAKGANSGLSVFRKYPFDFPDPVLKKYQKARVTVILKVAANGTVSSVDVQDNQDPDLVKAIRDNFGPWLFMPTVRAGKAMAGTVKVPLNLQ